MMAPKLGLFLAELKGRKVYLVGIVLVLLVGCRPAGNSPLTADMPLHLEKHLDDATIIGSEVRADLLQPMEWRFDEPQPDWKPATPFNPTIAPAEVSRTGDALRVTLTDRTREVPGEFRGGIYIDLPDLNRALWAGDCPATRAGAAYFGSDTYDFNASMT